MLSLMVACGVRGPDADSPVATAPAPTAATTAATTTAAPPTAATTAAAPPTAASTTAAPPTAASPALPTVASTCAAPFVVPPPYPESWIDDAAASPPSALGPWPTRAMAGPFATREAAAAGCAEIARLPPAAPFDAIVHCATGDRTRGVGPDNVAEHRLLVHTARGWWSQPLVRDFWPHDGDHEPRVAYVRDLAAGDHVGDGGAEITAIAEDGPGGGSKTRRVILCGVGPSTTPACADVRVAAGGPFHGAGAVLYRLELACDGALAIAGWEGGTPVRLVHGRGRLAFP